jgi:hypothetical protein
MKRELQEILLRKYHVFFDWVKTEKDVNLNTGVVYPIQFGIECGDGWFWLLDNLMESIYKYQKYNTNQEGNKEFIKIQQIKEKFGGLRFYISGGNSTIHGMIWLAEALSYKTCEDCGTTEGVGMTQGWIKVCCKPCHDKSRVRNQQWKPNKNNRLEKLIRIKYLLKN